MRMVAEVIASAFASGLSWRGALGGKESTALHPGLNRYEVLESIQ